MVQPAQIAFEHAQQNSNHIVDQQRAEDNVIVTQHRPSGAQMVVEELRQAAAAFPAPPVEIDAGNQCIRLRGAYREFALQLCARIDVDRVGRVFLAVAAARAVENRIGRNIQHPCAVRRSGTRQHPGGRDVYRLRLFRMHLAVIHAGEGRAVDDYVRLRQRNHPLGLPGLRQVRLDHLERRAARHSRRARSAQHAANSMLL